MKQRKIVWIAEQDHRLAKSMSSIQGMTLEEYFSQKIQQDAEEFSKKLQQTPQKQRRKQFDFPF